LACWADHRATLFTHRTLLGRDAGVTLIVVLLTLKTLELRARRDAFVVFFLGFFTMLTNFFFSQSLLTAAAMLVGLLGLLTALVNAHMPVGKPPLRRRAHGRQDGPGGRAHHAGAVHAVPAAGAAVGHPQRCAAGAAACRPPCRWAISPAWHWTTASRCACASRARCRARASCISAARCCPPLTGANGAAAAPGSARFPRLQCKANLQVRGPPVRYEVTMEPSNRPGSWCWTRPPAPELSRA
jgi:hypothetical protein